jgi:hypothetical protein
MCKILADVEAADDCQATVPVEPVDRPPEAWSKQEVDEILDDLVPPKVRMKAASSGGNGSGLVQVG